MHIPTILIFLFILKTGGVISQAYSEYITGTILLLSFILLRNISIKIFFKLISIITIFYILFLINHTFSTFTYKIYIIFFYTSICATYFIDKKELFVEVLEKVLYLILIHSFINYILVLFHLYIIPLPFESLSDKQSSVKTLYYIFNYYQPISSFNGVFGLPRNNGLFWEPGVLQIYLNLYLYVKLFLKNESLSKYTAFGIFSVFITQSTTGLIIMSIILFSKYFRLNKKNIVYILLLLLLFIYFIYPFIAEKLFGEKVGSGLVRLSDMYIAYKVFMDNFLFGYGFEYYTQEVYTNLYIQYMYDLMNNLNIPISIINEIVRKKVGSTHDYLKIGAVYGVFIFFIFNYGWYNLAKQYSNSGYLFLFIIILFISMEPVGTSPFNVFLAMYGFGIFTNRIKYYDRIE